MRRREKGTREEWEKRARLYVTYGKQAPAREKRPPRKHSVERVDDVRSKGGKEEGDKGTAQAKRKEDRRKRKEDNETKRCGHTDLLLPVVLVCSAQKQRKNKRPPTSSLFSTQISRPRQTCGCANSEEAGVQSTKALGVWAVGAAWLGVGRG